MGAPIYFEYVESQQKRDEDQVPVKGQRVRKKKKKKGYIITIYFSIYFLAEVQSTMEGKKRKNKSKKRKRGKKMKNRMRKEKEILSEVENNSSDTMAISKEKIRIAKGLIKL